MKITIIFNSSKKEMFILSKLSQLINFRLVKFIELLCPCRLRFPSLAFVFAYSKLEGSFCFWLEFSKKFLNFFILSFH